jgi:hypothetical protein
MDLNYLINQIKDTPDGLRLRLAKVVSINANKSVNIQLAGDANVLPSLKCLDHFLPAVNKQIWVLTSGADMLGIGLVAGNSTFIAPTTTRATTQSIPASTWTAISFSSVDGDGYTAWSASNPTRVTAPTAGRYMAVGSASFANDTSGYRGIRIQKSGSTVISADSSYPPPLGATVETFLNVTCQAITMATTDYLELQLLQTTAGALATGTLAPSLSLIYLGS